MKLANAITISRIALAPIIFVLIIYRMLFPAIILLALAFLTDIIDGYVARKLKQRSRLGNILDPAADKILILLVLPPLLVVFGNPETNWIYWIIFFSRDIFNFLIWIFARVDIKGAYARKLGKSVTVLQAVAIFWIMLQLPYYEFWIYAVFVLGIIAGIDYLIAFRKRLKKHR